MARVPGTRRRRRALAVLPSIPDDAPAEMKNALAIRNACLTEGRCPSCGTTPRVTVDRHGFGHLTFEHDDSCPVLRDDGSYGGETNAS